MILIMGPAGAGKSTQGQLLAERHDYTWVSTGELLRRADTAEFKEQMEKGALLSDELVERVVKDALEKVENLDTFILDGFPRDAEQASWLLKLCEEKGYKINDIIHLTIDFQAAHDRLLERGRPDDNELAIAERFREYREVTLPILKRFKEAGIEILEIDGNAGVDAVHERIVKHLGLG